MNFIDLSSLSLRKNIIFYGFILVFCLLLSQRLFTRSLSDYSFQEWLINYSHGFVRRGLIGSFFLFIHHQYNVSGDSIFTIAFVFCYTIFLLVVSIYLFKVRRYKKTIDLESLTVILFLPSLILFPLNLFPLNDTNAIGRKEFLFFLALCLNLFLLDNSWKNLQINSDYNSTDNPEIIEEEINKYCYRLFLGYNFLSIPTALSHEAILFLGIPINLIDKIKGKLSEQAETLFPNSIDIINRFSFKYAFIPFLFSGIMYVIALDWGRWLFIIALSYAFCLLSPCLLDLEILNYQQNNKLLGVLSPLYSTYTKGITYLHRKSFLNRFYPIYFLALMYTLLLLKLPVVGIQNYHFFTGLLYNLYQVFNN